MAQTFCDGCKAPNPAMQCPKCKQLGLPPAFFCGQACFKENWNTHKERHTNPGAIINTMSDIDRMLFRFTGPLRPGKITPKRVVPATIKRPDYADAADGRSPSEESDTRGKITIWKGEELEKLRRVCALSREVLDIGVKAVQPGVTTDEIDRVVHEATVERGMYPSPLNYYNFPKSVCTSINEVICHGIPDSRPLEEGDIINVDVSSYLGGVHGDLNETVFVGKPDADSARLVHCTYESLMASIATVTDGALYKHCGDAIEAVATAYGCSVVRAYSGHGIGDKFHTAPSIPHYANNKTPGVMRPGHVFTIEPMINLGTWNDTLWPDKWTATTVDGKRSAQFEHTMVVKEKGGVELLTDWSDHVPTYQKQLAGWGIPLPQPLTPLPPKA